MASAIHSKEQNGDPVKCFSSGGAVLRTMELRLEKELSPPRARYFYPFCEPFVV